MHGKQQAGGGPETSGWKEVWLTRPTPVADAENYSVWRPPALPDTVPHPVDVETQRYLPAPQPSDVEREAPDLLRETLENVGRWLTTHRADETISGEAGHRVAAEIEAALKLAPRSTQQHSIQGLVEELERERLREIADLIDERRLETGWQTWGYHVAFLRSLAAGGGGPQEPDGLGGLTKALRNLPRSYPCTDEHGPLMEQGDTGEWLHIDAIQAALDAAAQLVRDHLLRDSGVRS